MLCCAASGAFHEGQHVLMLWQHMFEAHHTAEGHVGFRKAAHGLHVGQEMEQLVACRMTLVPQAGHEARIEGVPHANQRRT